MQNFMPASQADLQQCPTKAVNALSASFPTIVDFGKTYNVAMQEKCAANPMRCVTGKAPTLGLMCSTYGKADAKRWLFGQIVNLSRYCGGNAKNFCVEALQELSGVIMGEYYYLNAAEMLLFFYRFKCGEYGKFYKSFEPITIMQALKTFNAERSALVKQAEKETAMKQRAEWAKDSITREQFNEIKERAIHRDKDAIAIIGWSEEFIQQLRNEKAQELWNARKTKQEKQLTLQEKRSSYCSPSINNPVFAAKFRRQRTLTAKARKLSTI